MSKYRRADKLTQEQRKEIGVLINCGIPTKALATDYGISVHNIRAIARQRQKWIPEDLIARTPKDKFLYAQTIYKELGPNAVRYIDSIVFEPLARKALPILLRRTITPAERLINHILSLDWPAPKSCTSLYESIHADETSVTRNDSSGEYSNRLMSYALIVVKDCVRRGVFYANLWAALDHIVSAVPKLDEATLKPSEQMLRASLARGVEKLLTTLTYREREIVKLRWGLGDGYTYTLEEVGRIFQATRERVRQVEFKALRKLRHPVRSRKLEAILSSARKQRDSFGVDDLGLTYEEEPIEACQRDIRDNPAK